MLVQHGSVALPRALPASPSSASLRASRAAARRGRSASVAPLRASSAQPPKQQPALIRGMRLLAGALAAPAREALSADERSARPRERSTSPPKRERSAEKLKFRTIFISDLHLVRIRAVRAKAAGGARHLLRIRVASGIILAFKRFGRLRLGTAARTRAVRRWHRDAALRTGARASATQPRRCTAPDNVRVSLARPHCRAPRAARRSRCWISCVRRSASACTLWATSWTCGRAAAAASTGRRCVSTAACPCAERERADACAVQSHSDVIQKLLKKARKGTKSASRLAGELARPGTVVGTVLDAAADLRFLAYPRAQLWPCRATTTKRCATTCRIPTLSLAKTCACRDEQRAAPPSPLYSSSSIRALHTLTRAFACAAP